MSIEGTVMGGGTHGGESMASMDVTKPCEFIRFGAMDVTKPYEFIGFGAMDVTLHRSPKDRGRPVEHQKRATTLGRSMGDAVCGRPKGPRAL